MNAQQLDALVVHARRCDAAWAHKFRSVGSRDAWAAHLRDAADMVEITIGDPDQAALVVGATLVLNTVSAQMMRDSRVTWSPAAHDVAAMPGQLASALLLPYLERGGR